MPHGRYAVITTRDRHQLLAAAAASVSRQVNDLLIIDHLSIPPVTSDTLLVPVTVCRYDNDAVNISRLWNTGLNWAARRAADRGKQTWDVAILNDDITLPSEWVARVADTMRSTTAVVACSGDVPAPLLRLRHDTDISRRLQGWAWITRGEAGLRLDERFVWWWGDTDLDWRARQSGGMLLVPGEQPRHYDPGGWTNRSAELTQQAGRDRVTFIDKWGKAPW